MFDYLFLFLTTSSKLKEIRIEKKKKLFELISLNIASHLFNLRKSLPRQVLSALCHSLTPALLWLMEKLR